VIATKNCLDENGIECEEPGRRMCEALTGHAKWKKTSYNTRMGVHYDSNTGEPSEDQSKAYRLNYALEGMKYDEQLNGFVVTESIHRKRVPRMVINPQTGYWYLLKPPIPVPEDLQLDEYPLDTYQEPWFWHEYKFEWVKIKNTELTHFYHFLDEEMI
jgi:hypothetical protein